MHSTQRILETHPRKPRADFQEIISCIDACFDCAQACTSCADACVGEKNAQLLARCIRLNLDCADVCEATGRVLSRQTEPDGNLIRAQLQALLVAVGACGNECARHSIEHCRVCREACRRCEESCDRLLKTFPASQAAAA